MGTVLFFLDNEQSEVRILRRNRAIPCCVPYH